MRTVILCGGKGTRLQEATGGVIPKPMVRIGGRPILWHIMQRYAANGHKDFVLALGHQQEVIRDYFLRYDEHNADVEVCLLGGVIPLAPHKEDWTVILSDTGQDTMTGGRLARVRPYVEDETFMVTYGDGLADIDLDALLAFHRAHGKIATVTGVRPPGRFGRLDVRSEHGEGEVVSFAEKPADGRVNGGFFVFEPRVFDYLGTDSACVLERGPLEWLARDGELRMFAHDGFWQCMDTYHDLLALEGLWATKAPWVKENA